jgi:hypothetical protein
MKEKWKVIDFQYDYDGAEHIYYTLMNDKGEIRLWTSSGPTYWAPESELEIYDIGDVIELSK